MLDFVSDIMPYVEKHYRVSTERQHRAIAGLSMGGSQTLNIAIPNLEMFAYIGVYSSGLIGAFGGGRGRDDGLITTTRGTVELLKKHGFEPVFKESSGGHTWINWRNYLSEFAPQLFQ